MERRNCLVLTQYRESDQYNDFIGKYYHFPATLKKNYLKEFTILPIDFVYYEPKKGNGKGEFYGYGRITKQPFKDKREPDHYFVEISEYKKFSNPVNYKDGNSKKLEEIYSPKHYNAQNAVRKTTGKFIDEVCLDGGIMLNFQADAHLVQILGEQLIESERVGILELVKNGFDAGASICKVRIEKIPTLAEISPINYRFNKYEGPVIIIEDNGSGMSRANIEDGWLRPASTLKTDVKERIKKEREIALKSGKEEVFESFLEILKSEHKGRVPLGEKGVGRFACHRLGRKLIIKSKVPENDYEYLLEIDWDDFENVLGEHKDLNSIGISLKRQALSRDYGLSNSGTQLIIFGGREGFELDEDEIRSINRAILKLNSPNPNPKITTPKFLAEFECPQIKGLDEKVDYSEYKPVFTISGIVNELGLFNFDFKFDPPYNKDIPLNPIEEFDQVLDLRTIVNKNEDKWIEEIKGKKFWRTPQCGPFYIHLDVWYRDKPWKDNLDEAFLSYLSKFGGISIFRDGINIFPAEWGAEKDWLGLRQRQIKQSKRMSYYHMLGNVEIQQGVNVLLMDKTNREGMVGNRAAKDLQQLVKAVAFYLENFYMGKRDERNSLTSGIIREPRILNNAVVAATSILKNINESYDIIKDPNNLFVGIEDIERRKSLLDEISNALANLKDNLAQIEDVHDLLTEQAGFGLGIAVALHEINKTASNFYYGVVELIESGDFNEIKLNELKHQSEALEAEMSRLSPLRVLRNEKSQLFNISRSIKFVESLFKSRFEKLGIHFSYNEEDFSIKARFGSLNQILTNLLDNSCYWMDNPDITDRKIRVEVSKNERTIIIADSGQGIPDSIMPYLFQPGYSLKTPPSGLGTYICRYYMNLMQKRGEIYLVKPKERIAAYEGAQFLLDFSNVREE